jgi:hypothetical protein
MPSPPQSGKLIVLELDGAAWTVAEINVADTGAKSPAVLGQQMEDLGHRG